MSTAEDLFPTEFDRNELEAVEEPENVENTEDNQPEEEAAKVVKPKRIVRNPQPKLNPETLKGSKGLGAVASYFGRVKFKGRGHEEQDLNVLLKTYEYWCHRLFPKYPFDECIAKIESLGTKRAVVTHIKRIRMDLLLEDNAIINEGIDEEPVEEHEENQFDALVDVEPSSPVEFNEEQAERMRLNRERAEKLKQDRLRKMRESTQPVESQNSQGLQTQSTSTSHFSDDQGVDEILVEIHAEPKENNEIGGDDTLSEEQAERIRLNREKAERLRQQRLIKIRESAQSSLGESSRLPPSQNSQEPKAMDTENLNPSKVASEHEVVDDIVNTNGKNIEEILNEINSDESNSAPEAIFQEVCTDEKNVEDLLDIINSAVDEVPVSMDCEEK